jgi:predicted HTH transcriptional regulator
MTNILFFIVGIAFGFYIKGKTTKSTGETFASKSEDEMEDIRTEAHEALTERTESRKQKILNLMKDEAVHQEELKSCNVADIKKGITSENVEKLLDVSNTTAGRYLNALEAENKIKQVGKSGKGVYTINLLFPSN